MSLSARLTTSVSQFLNERGIYLGRRSGRLHVALYHWSGGRIGGHMPGWPEVPIMLLDHRGARSGIRRTSPLIYQRVGGSIVVAASKAGQPTNPAWFHNLVAHPDTTVQTGSEIHHVRARVASDDERERLWARLAGAFPGYEFYRRNAGRRRIPIVILDPRRVDGV